MKTSQLITVLVSVPSSELGEQIAHQLVSAHIAACVNILPKMKSVYSWKGAVEVSEEFLLIIKTSSHRFGALQQEVRTLHPYDTPEIIALPITDAFSEYANWVLQESSEQ